MATQQVLKRCYQIHKWTSLICTLFMLLLCLTGLPLIFADEINRALGDSVAAPELPDNPQGIAVDVLIRDAIARNPGHSVQFLVGNSDEPNLWSVRMGVTADAPEPSAFHTYDARSGELLRTHRLGQGLMNVLFRLHIDLFAGLPGTLFLGCMGILLAASLVSGTVLYGPYMRKLTFGTVRRQRSIRLKWLDLHNLLGIVTLVWLLTVTLTGVINTLADPLFGRWQATELALMLAPFRDKPAHRHEYPVQQAVNAAYQSTPGMMLSFMAFPGNDFAGPNHFMAFMQGATPLTSKLLQPVLIDADTAQVVATRALPAYISALLISQPLHFGDYGGLPLKILWALLDLLSIIVLGSGVYLWLKKRHAGFIGDTSALSPNNNDVGDAEREHRE